MTMFRKAQPGDALRIGAADYNAAMDAARAYREHQHRIAAAPGGRDGFRGRGRFRGFWARVTETPPDGQSRYRDNRYWVERIEFDPSGLAFRIDSFPEPRGLDRPITATNLAEDDYKSHGVPAGTPVWVWAYGHGGMAFHHPAPIFPVQITSGGAPDSTWLTDGRVWAAPINSADPASISSNGYSPHTWVALPFEARPVWDGQTMDGIAYANYSGIGKNNSVVTISRTATRNGVNEAQVYWPPYRRIQSNDLEAQARCLWVARVNETGVVDENGEPVRLLDLNVTGRAWYEDPSVDPYL